MLRIRDSRGAVQILSEAHRFVEICDTDGKIARLIYTDEQGIMRVVGANDPEAARYAKIFGVEFCPVVKLEI